MLGVLDEAGGLAMRIRQLGGKSLKPFKVQIAYTMSLSLFSVSTRLPSLKCHI